MGSVINMRKPEPPVANPFQIAPLAVVSIDSVKDKIAEFVLELYCGRHFQEGRLIRKELARRLFVQFVKANKYENYFSNKLDIGTILRQASFLIDTPRGSGLYCLSVEKVFNFVKENLNFLFEDLAGTFLLNLLHQLKIDKNGNIFKSEIELEYDKYTENYERLNELFGQVLIETMLRDHNFLDTEYPHHYCIAMEKLFAFRNSKIEQLDESRRKGKLNRCGLLELKDEQIEKLQLVSTKAEKFPVVYQGGGLQCVNTEFILTSMGCYICQQNFGTQRQLEDHIISHGLESDFEFLSEAHKRMPNIFEINYHLCDKSHYFFFTMKTKMKDIVLRKIIIIQSRRMQFIRNNLVPYEIPPDGLTSFIVDSHLFTLGVEQPIVIVYTHKFDNSVRFFEQHHFLRLEEFPKVNFPIRSYRLPQGRLLENKNKLADYMPAKWMQACQKTTFSDETLRNSSEDFRKYLDNGKILSPENMCNVLEIMVHIEDIETAKEYCQLFQRKAPIKKFGCQYSVKLRKLPKHVYLENIVTPLDEIVLIPTKSEHESKKKKKYFSVIERVSYDTVFFEYKKGTIPEMETYDVILRPSRLSTKYQLRALQMLSYNPRIRNYLFPSDHSILPMNPSTEKLDLFNTSIENNLEQLQAVRNIAIGPDVAAPFILFGPPGTGKTSTIVETVLQLWKRRPETRILISSGSNSACDEVAVRLCRELVNISPEKPNILRIFAKSNEKRLDSIDEVLIQSSNFYSSHFYPSLINIRQYRIIVCTLSVAGRLVSAPIGGDFFTHIFIDECGASTEPEILVGWMGTSSLFTRLIVSGDPKQLGPVLKSSRAADLGLKVSFMERLMNRKCYEVDEKGNYNRSIQARLIRNYRSHPEIVRLYNHLYYNNELKALAPEGETTWAMQWHMLPNQYYPIVFHSVYGHSKKNGSLSLCNELEINVVMDYVKDLMFFGINGRKITESDIGIISPYKKQYTLIQEELNLRRWSQIEVGAVETFQGREKSIIIVSTVRSFTNTLGFLDCPRRLNVVLSRAKALLIIIGNPETLSKNKDYKFIIGQCRRKGSFIESVKSHAEYNSINVNNLMAQLSLNNTQMTSDKLSRGGLKSKPKKYYKNEKKATNLLATRSGTTNIPKNEISC